jgi:hypothetical protein
VPGPHRSWWPAVGLGLSALSAAAVRYFFRHGWLQWYGDAEAHLNIARRIFDSQTPGYDQIGSPWLPLPHLLTVPFVRVDAWWHSGIAGSFAPAAAFVLGGVFLYLAVYRTWESRAAAAAATALTALNPNLLYLQSASMTEAIFFCCLTGLLYCSVRFRDTQGWGAVAGAGASAFAGTMTRYEGWFLLPFAAGWFWYASRPRRLGPALWFCLSAGAGPVYWLGHNWYLSGDPLYFYRGPYSARAIQGNAVYPGLHDWHTAWFYYRTAVELCAGPGLCIMALAGILVALSRRTLWPLLLLALPGVFFVWSIHSSGLPIHVPMLWPHSYYNTRYGLAVLPLLAFAAAALVLAVPPRMRAITAVLVVTAGGIHWAAHRQPEEWITWMESRVNSTGRRAWTHRAAQYLSSQYVRGSGIISSGGDDFAGIYREMGIPLRETFSTANGLPWLATVQRPELHLRQEWAVVKQGDPVQRAVERAGQFGIRYRLELTVKEKDEPVIEIYRRVGGTHGKP